MSKKRATERTFQGELYRIINKIVENNPDLNFNKITQEEQVGINNSRFADGKLYSKQDRKKIISFELKNSKWDATDEALVKDAFTKASQNGYEYFVTGTPRQLVVFKTFEPGTTIYDRKLKIYQISNVKKDDDVLLPYYENQIIPKLNEFLKDLSNLIHGVEELYWDSIDKFFVNKLSAYILEASEASLEPLYQKIKKNSAFKKRLKQYLTNQDIFNVTLSFDYEDVYKITQLSNYLLYLKIIFYIYIQRDVKELNLKHLDIPLDNKLLNKVLKQRFDDVLEWDYESIFTKTVLDELLFEKSFLPVLKTQIEELNHFDFKDLKADIIGAIYNTLIDNQEQHDRGQHFTNTDEVDIVNAFCINEDTFNVIDTGCGAGTFLVRAYKFIKHFHPTLTHEQLLERIWGIEIAPFPVFLSTMNLCLLDVKSIDNYPIILQNDFCKIDSEQFHHLRFINATNKYQIKNLQGREADVKISKFDACIGNPPYIRQELIEDKDCWLKHTELEWGLKVNKQSDLYLYYLMHTASFLKKGKRLGYVISSSWLDVSFGKDLQEYLINNFKIIAIIDQHGIRSFETASINTVILIIERCDNAKERENNNVKFVRIYKNYKKLIGNSDNKNRIDNVISFTSYIINTNKGIKNDDYFILVKNQKELYDESIVKGKFTNGHWGAKYLRAPEILKKIIDAGKDKLIKLDNVCEIKRGFTTGSNDFYYLADHTFKIDGINEVDFKMFFGYNKDSNAINWKNYGWYYSNLTKRHYLIEKKYVKPLFKSQKEANKLDVDLDNLNYSVIICNDSKDKLIKLKNHFLKYISDAEKLNVHKNPTCAVRNPWYNLSNSAFIGDFIFPSKIGEKYRLIDNRETKVLCDKVNYIIKIRKEYEDLSDIIFLILNSQLFRYFVDLFARQLTGNQTLSDADVNVVQNTLIPNPKLLLPFKKELNKIYNSLKAREQGTIFEEVKMDDKKELDNILLGVLGLSTKDVDDLYFQASKYILDRKKKSETMKTSKSKQKLSYDDTLKIINDRFNEITKYKDLVKKVDNREVMIPDWKAHYPKDIFSENLFGLYNVKFTKGDKDKSISFDNPEQLKLFKFLNDILDIKGKKIFLPAKKEDCKKILQILQTEYSDNIILIRNLIKTYRSKADVNTLYRDLILN